MPPRPTVEFLLLQRHQSGYRLACLRDDDLLAGGRFLDESGQVRLCGVHVDRLHSLAKLSLTYQWNRAIPRPPLPSTPRRVMIAFMISVSSSMLRKAKPFAVPGLCR